MFRKQKTVAPHFRMPNPFNPMGGEQHHLNPPMRPYCRFTLTEALTTADERAEAVIAEDRFQWGPGMYHLTCVKIIVRNLLDKDETAYEFSGEIDDIGIAVWDVSNHWRIIWLGRSGGGNRVAISTVVIPKRVGRVAGGPVEVQPVKLDSSSPPEFVNDGDPVNIYSWVKTDSTDPADEEDGELYIFIEDDDHGVTWFTGQDCPPGADVET